MKKLFIFDLDGTVANTLDSLAYSANACLSQLGLPPNPTENYKYYCGEGGDIMIKRSLIAAGDVDLKLFHKAMALYRNIFLDGCLYKVTAYEGMKETLDKLKAMGIHIAVLTNKAHENAIYVLNHIYGENYFDCILGQRDSHKRKPSPEGAVLIQNQFNAASADCVYVGDTATDMETGKAASIFTIGAAWGFRDETELYKFHADIVISHPKELLNFIS